MDGRGRTEAQWMNGVFYSMLCNPNMLDLKAEHVLILTIPGERSHPPVGGTIKGQPRDQVKQDKLNRAECETCIKLVGNDPDHRQANLKTRRKMP